MKWGAFVAFLAVLVLVNRSEASDVLDCRLLNKAELQCNVLADEIKINSVTVNRGRCPPPEQVALENWKAGEETIKWLCANRNWSAARDKLCDGYAPKKGGSFEDYRKLYKFGDAVVMDIRCPNLLEFTVSTSLGNLTYQVEH